MKLKEIRRKPWFRLAGNIYILVLTVFVIWMVFFDQNSLLIHLELRREIRKLEKQQEFLKEQIANDRQVIEKLSDPKELEKFAREQYLLKRKDEEIYLIDFSDSLKNEDDGNE